MEKIQQESKQPKNLPGTNNNYSKIAGYMVNKQKAIVFLYKEHFDIGVVDCKQPYFLTLLANEYLAICT